MEKKRKGKKRQTHLSLSISIDSLFMSESLKSRLAEAESEANSEVSGGAGGAGGVEYAAMSWETKHVKLVVVKHTERKSILGAIKTLFSFPTSMTTV